jgi:GNAT superfamily N-acetyltransferase
MAVPIFERQKAMLRRPLGDVLSLNSLIPSQEAKQIEGKIMSRPAMDTSTDWPLLTNHLAFISKHRGRVRYEDDAIDVMGDEDFLSCWIPTQQNARMPEAAHTVRTVPGSGPRWPQRLSAEGFNPAEVLLYMETPLNAKTLVGAGDGVIEVASRTDALAFAKVQGDGFLEQDDMHNTWWRTTFERMALKNYGDPNQHFYLARAGGVAAAVTLVVRTRGVFGIYAVATRPQFRGRGFASMLLERARLDAIKRGGERLCLQVVEGSYAERLYRKLNFAPAFPSPTYRRSS